MRCHIHLCFVVSWSSHCPGHSRNLTQLWQLYHSAFRASSRPSFVLHRVTIFILIKLSFLCSYPVKFAFRRPTSETWQQNLNLWSDSTSNVKLTFLRNYIAPLMQAGFVSRQHRQNNVHKNTRFNGKDISFTGCSVSNGARGSKCSPLLSLSVIFPWRTSPWWSTRKIVKRN